MPTFDSYTQGTPCWVDLATPDAAAAKAFYSQVFGWEYDDSAMPGGTYSFVKVDGHNVAALSGMSPEMAAQMPATWSTYLAVDDVDDVIAKVADAGGTVIMPTDEIPGSGRIAFLTDPTGAAFGLWEAGGHIGASLANEPNTLIWNECFTDDVEAAANFYDAVLGTTHQAADMPDGSTYTSLHVGEQQASVAGLMRRDPEAHSDVPNCWTVYFAVDDINHTAQKIADAGGRVLNGPFDTPVGPMLVASDAQGAIFQAMQPGQ